MTSKELSPVTETLYTALRAMVLTHEPGGDLVVDDRIAAHRQGRLALMAADNEREQHADPLEDLRKFPCEELLKAGLVGRPVRVQWGELAKDGGLPGRVTIRCGTQGLVTGVDVEPGEVITDKPGFVRGVDEARAARPDPALSRGTPASPLHAARRAITAEEVEACKPLDLDEALEPKPTRWACGFCGLDLGLWRKGDAKEMTAMAEHIDACDKHPMRKAVNEAAGLRSLLELAEERDIVKILTRQFAWSLLTYGEGCMTEAILKHIGKEVAEVRKDPHDAVEWIDIALLALDGAWRCRKEGHFSGGTIAALLVAKMAENRSRKWAQGADGVFEHVRDGATS